MVTMYMQIDGLRGESTDSEHKDWIELLSFSHSITQAASGIGPVGATAGRGQHSAYAVTKPVDMTSPKLYELCSSGKHIKSVTLEMMRDQAGKRMKYMEVRLEDVVISHAAPASSGDFPLDSVSFNYGTIKWTYTLPKRSDGSGAVILLEGGASWRTKSLPDRPAHNKSMVESPPINRLSRWKRYLKDMPRWMNAERSRRFCVRKFWATMSGRTTLGCLFLN